MPRHQIPPLSLGEDRNQFFERLRTNLGRPESAGSPPTPPVVDEAIIRLASNRDDLAALFVEHAQLVGMEVSCLTTNELANAIRSLLTEWDVSAAVISIKERELRSLIHDELVLAECQTCDWQNSDGMDAHFDADLSITDVAGALADSGSIILRSGTQQSRGAFLIPPIHLAILSASQILPDMIDYWPHFRKADAESPAAATVLVTGPSKTADIEGILITGVHGPGKVHILLIKDQ